MSMDLNLAGSLYMSIHGPILWSSNPPPPHPGCIPYHINNEAIQTGRSTVIIFSFNVRNNHDAVQMLPMMTYVLYYPPAPICTNTQVITRMLHIVTSWVNAIISHLFYRIQMKLPFLTSYEWYVSHRKIISNTSDTFYWLCFKWQTTSMISIPLEALTSDCNQKQGNQRWQIPRPPHASAWQRSPH